MKINPNAQLKIQLGSDGNPKIYACGTQMEQAALCTETIINIMTAAADFMDRMEETHQ